MTRFVARFLLFVLLTGLVSAGSAHAAGKKRVVLRPLRSGPEVTILVAGKRRTYHQLSATQSSVVEVIGPGELTILTRARISATAGEMGYGLIYTVDETAPQALDVESAEPASNAAYAEGVAGQPAEAEVLTLTFRQGRHRVTVWLRDSLPEVSARYLFAPRKAMKIRWIAMSPMPPVEPVDLIAGDQTIHCYRFSKERPLKISIIGPTRLRILTRLENTFNMKGRINYRIQVRQKDQVVQTFQLSSRRSETTQYKGGTKLVPGRVREIVLVVPKGLQEYEIVALDRHTILGQVLFPQKDARLEL